MPQADWIKTEAELSLVLHCLSVQRTEAAHLAEHVATEGNRAMYADQVAEIDALRYAILDRRAATRLIEEAGA